MSRLCSLSSLILAALVASAAPARADQCQLLPSPELAERAARVLREAGGSMLSYCEPCGERAPGQPVPVPAGAVAVVHQAEGWVVMVEGQELDLAYRYVLTERGQYENLAVLAGCPVHSVTPVLRVAPATSTGVLIYGDPGGQLAAPVASPASAAAPAAPDGAAARPAPTDDLISWLWLVLGGLGAMLSAALALRATGAAVHTPRALALVDAAKASAEEQAGAAEVDVARPGNP